MLETGIAYEAFRNALNALKPGWNLYNDALIGPGGALVRLAQLHQSESNGHLDVEFRLDANSGNSKPLWDCVCGFGDSPAERAQTAAHIWSVTTAGALLELKYSLKGEFADHYRGTDPDGFTGWHVVSGPILGYGEGASPDQLQQWWLNHSVLPPVFNALKDSLDPTTCPHGIKIFFGGEDFAEVRLDGEVHEAASQALATLPWPRLQPAAFVRSYVIAVHPEGHS